MTMENVLEIAAGIILGVLGVAGLVALGVVLIVVGVRGFYFVRYRMLRGWFKGW